MTETACHIPVCILAGGLGTRLAPYTTVLPKPLVPLGERPVLDILLGQLEAQGFEEVTLACGGMEGVFRAYLSNYSSRLTIRFISETTRLGTAGCLSTYPEPTPENLLVINGDILTDLDFTEVVQAHRDNQSQLTVAVHRLKHPLAYGVVDTDETGRVTGYREKPIHEVPVSMGIYVYQRRVLQSLPSGEALDFPDLVLRLLKDGNKVTSFHNKAQWYDIGSPGDLERALQALNEHPARFLPDREAGNTPGETPS